MNGGEPISSDGQVSVLGQSLDLRANLRALLGEHQPFVLLLLVTMALDAASTIAFMSIVGPGAEQNPIVRIVSYSLGIYAGPPVGKLFQLLAAFGLVVLAPRLTQFIITTVILMNLFAFVVNMHVFVLAR